MASLEILGNLRNGCQLSAINPLLIEGTQMLTSAISYQLLIRERKPKQRAGLDIREGRSRKTRPQRIER
jgi:hypothetical protein